ncbi:SH3 domain-containing protein [Phormidium sp. LEGE 05292]|uniref:SH3 domain-containing protein n=1 Tax=[Phormidium] sp. LEGE 05292 TaxID=767427 RepID=UPI00187DF40B|nr:SH3 domain-containing protein [Phormidium sp. LEGE 05292]MBE9226949.1 SH3 domain-containing protein [Phormidium sp. LEGE 05292]
MSFSGIVKFLIGFVIAIGLLAGAGIAGGLYFITKLTSPPEKPIFANEKNANKVKPVAAKVQPPAASTPKATEVSANTNTPTPISETKEKPLEPGTYKGRVIWSSGLSLRDNPSSDSERIGGVAYNEEVVVLSESDDKRWVRVRSEDGSNEGWVKARNIKRVEEGEQAQASNQ